MKIEKIELSSLDENTYLIYDDISKEGVIIDPGGEVAKIRQVIDSKDIKLKYILLTHSHADHIGGAEEIRDQYGAKIAIHENEKEMLANGELNLSPYIFGRIIEIQGDIFLKDGDIIEFANEKIEVIFTPGHSPGGVSFKIKDHIFVGDAIFKGSIGRTDLYKGNQVQLIKSIKERILSLSNSTKIYPGHGPETTVEIEKMTNPFVQL